jgi:hypothetical protein
MRKQSLTSKKCNLQTCQPSRTPNFPSSATSDKGRMQGQDCSDTPLTKEVASAELAASTVPLLECQCFAAAIRETSELVNADQPVGAYPSTVIAWPTGGASQHHFRSKGRTRHWDKDLCRREARHIGQTCRCRTCHVSVAEQMHPR